MSETYSSEGLECPHCHEVDQDAWELDGDSGKTQCASCGKNIEWSRDTTVTYTANKATETP